MKKSFLIAVALFVFTACAQGAEKDVLAINGTVEGKGVSLTPQTIIQGRVTLTEGEYGGGKVNGSLSLTKVKVLNDLIVRGGLAAKNSIFSKKVTIEGGLESVKSTFLDDLSIKSNKVELNDTIVNNLMIQKATTLYLNGNCVIKGSIEFQDSKGVVYIGNGSKINGKIINGASEKQ